MISHHKNLHAAKLALCEPDFIGTITTLSNFQSLLYIISYWPYPLFTPLFPHIFTRLPLTPYRHMDNSLFVTYHHFDQFFLVGLPLQAFVVPNPRISRFRLYFVFTLAQTQFLHPFIHDWYESFVSRVSPHANPQRKP